MNREIVPEKAQERIFNKLLARTENLICADCPAKGPRWVSLDFGIFICMNCSGAHRNLGPSTTRVRSSKLDSWVPEFIEIMDNIGNKKANEYWEFNKQPNSKSLRQESTNEERIRYVREKYVYKKFANQNAENPVHVFLKEKVNGGNTNKNQLNIQNNDNKQFHSENTNDHHELQHPLKQVQKYPSHSSGKQQQQPQISLMDMDDDHLQNQNPQQQSKPVQNHNIDDLMNIDWNNGEQINQKQQNPSQNQDNLYSINFNTNSTQQAQKHPISTQSPPLIQNKPVQPVQNQTPQQDIMSLYSNQSVPQQIPQQQQNPTIDQQQLAQKKVDHKRYDFLNQMNQQQHSMQYQNIQNMQNMNLQYNQYGMNQNNHSQGYK